MLQIFYKLAVQRHHECTLSFQLIQLASTNKVPENLSIGFPSLYRNFCGAFQIRGNEFVRGVFHNPKLNVVWKTMSMFWKV